MRRGTLYKILSYFPMLFVISFFCKDKDNASVIFHRRPGMILTICSSLLMTFVRFFAFLFGWIPVIGAVISNVLYYAVLLLMLAGMVIGVYHVCTDNDEELPLVGKLFDRFFM